MGEGLGTKEMGPVMNTFLPTYRHIGKDVNTYEIHINELSLSRP